MLFMLDVYMFFFILLKVLKSTCALCLYLKMGEITMENLDSLFDKKLAPIRSTLEDLTTSASFLSERFDAIEQKVKDLEITADTVQKENNYLRLETLRLSKIIEEMKDNINDMEQYSRRECCEITGIPETPDEDTNDLVIKVGALMDIELDEDDISVSHRLPTPSYASRVAMASSSRPNHTTIQPKIIVKFVRKETKELFYTNRKHLRGKTTADLGLGRYSDNGLFISESLTQRNRMLFKECLAFKRKYNYKYIWTQQGRIYLRKGRDMQSRLISSKSDIESDG